MTDTSIVICNNKETDIYESARRKCPWGATGIVRRVDDLGRIVIPKEIRRTLRIREGDPSLTTLTPFDLLLQGIIDFAQRITTE